MLDFLRDKRGNYALMTVIAMLPLMGGLAIAVDYSEMSRQKQITLNALDAAAIATARHVVSGASNEALIAYANDFFEANLNSVDPDDTELHVQLPSSETGGGTLKLSATLNYRPYFYPAFRELLGDPLVGDEATIVSQEDTEVRLKNTLEVALVLDNSGSMSEYGSGSGQKRIDLLKTAAKQLVDTLALQASMIKQVDKPVQFALVPFAASVNVGPDNAGAAWMDTAGISPTHHENFDWTVMSSGEKRAQKINGVWYKKGSEWGEDQDDILSRFSLYKDMKKVAEREWIVTGQEWVCTEYRKNGTCKNGYYRDTGHYEEIIGPFASWQGCVEARPYPYNVTDAAADAGISEIGIQYGDPASLFVPMFAPDEPGNLWTTQSDGSIKKFSAPNSWWDDITTSTSTSTSNQLARQAKMSKYFETRPYGISSAQGSGPNYSCTTTPITQLTDVTVPAGLATIKGAIDAMAANGNTNVPEGLAWGWRTVSSGEPFSTGRPDTEKGNDKVVIVLTDGINTYTAPGTDPAGNKATYAAHGYMKPGYNGTSTARLFMNTSSSIGQFDYSSSNYTAAMNEHLNTLCNNAKEKKILLMTVSLDLSTSDTQENKAIESLKKCSSDSRFRKGSDGKPAKLFWNATGSNLAEKFKEIADELSNLRIVS